MDTPLETLVMKTFVPYVNSRFRVESEAGPAVELELVELLSRGPDDNPFSLFFRGPASPPLPQATYAFAHAELGRFVLFITPVAGDAAGYTYEALFNRLHRSR
jgi:hypothetical protein